MNDSPRRNADPYRALGVRPFINCASVRTAHSGSLMLPQVRAAIDRASRAFVGMDELMEGASRRIAELTGAEWGIVTCGSAAALTLSTAACVAGNDPVKIMRLPFTEGLPNRVIMPRNQRFAYDQSIRAVGTHIIEIETIADLDAALEQPVAMIAVLGTHEDASAVRLKDIVPRARARGIPVLVDAASEHIARPIPWLERGADLVIYSGGKFLRGPQTSGLLLGRKNLVQAAWANASPHQGFARGMKVSKEDVIGVLAALEVWFEERDPAVELRRWNEDLAEIARHLHMPGVTTRVIEPRGVVLVPRLEVAWDASHPLAGEGLRLRLLEGDPRIMLDDMATGPKSVQIDPFGLQPDEARQVGEAVARAVRDAEPQAAGRTAPPNVDLSGTWAVTIRFLHGTRAHRLTLHQDGARLSGEQHSDGFEGSVTGEITPAGVSLLMQARYEGSTISFHLTGEAGPDRMHGRVVLGSMTDHHQGPINLAQFGTAAWEAVTEN